MIIIGIIIITKYTEIYADENNNVDIIDNKIILNGSKDNSNPDFFGECTKNLMPGDKKTVYVNLKNCSSETVEIFFYTKKTDLNEKEKEISEKLLNNIFITIDLEQGNTIYDSQLNSKEKPISLGYLKSSDSSYMKVTIEVSKKINNEFQDLIGKTDWVFLIQEYKTTNKTLIRKNKPRKEIEQDIESNNAINLKSNIKNKNNKGKSRNENIEIDDKTLGKLPQTGTFLTIRDEMLEVCTLSLMGLLIIITLAIGLKVMIKKKKVNFFNYK